MALGKAQESVEGPSIKRYIGATPVFVKCVNPSKEERNKLLGAEIESEPVYLDELEVDGKKIPQLRVTFYVQPVEEEVIIPVTFFLRKEHRFNGDKTKVQVIDKYGYSGWATQEQLKNHGQLKSSSGKNLRITTSYRPAYNGEIQLMEFIKAYLNIADYLAYINEDWVSNPKVTASDCECSLDMEALFKGNFTELFSVPKMMPTNKVKMMFGVRTTEEGKQYQAAYTNKVLKNSARDYSEIDKDLQERKKNGAYQNIEYDVKPFREYAPEPTDFSKEPQSDMPFQEGAESPWGFN